MKKARRIFRVIENRTRRRAYIRSSYFKKEKIFFDYFWIHLNQKSRRERTERLSFFVCAIEVIVHSRFAPEIQDNPREILYRFCGKTKSDELFFVQIKENKKSRQKYFMSVFPQNKNPPQ